jgi:hypothetical protein
MFPASWPGCALLLLRLAMALLLENAAHRHGLSAWITGASLVVCAALVAGYHFISPHGPLNDSRFSRTARNIRKQPVIGGMFGGFCVQRSH